MQAKRANRLNIFLRASAVLSIVVFTLLLLAAAAEGIYRFTLRVSTRGSGKLPADPRDATPEYCMI